MPAYWIPPVTGGRSVEHFAPKKKHRDFAYEWDNHRLVCSVMNSRKRDFEDVLDPLLCPGSRRRLFKAQR